ncbi:MAG: hypothetical protein LAP39_01840 [Acidobacteriia bacterium]|nr:hypothetical protein [Terriglobia bacterium]
MMLSLFVLVCIAHFPAGAQSPAHEHYLNDVHRGAPGSRAVEDQFDRPIFERENAQYKEKQFRLKTQAFVDLWTALAREYKEKGTFNIKLAKEVSKAFHALEKSEGWPKVGRR